MKKLTQTWLLVSSFLFCMSAPLLAQDKIVIDKQEATSFLERNWIWLAIAAVAVLILISAGSARKKSITSTTVMKDDLGNIKRVETTKVQDL